MRHSKNIVLYLSLIFTYTIIIYVFNYLIFTKDAFYETFQDQFAYFKIDKIFEYQLKNAWTSYVIWPIWIFIKVFVISLCVQIGLVLHNTKLKFSTTFGISLTSEFIFLLPQLIKLAWFLFIKTDYTLTDLQQFYPLSALNLFKIENLSTLLIYPLQTFNVFEILYWILLAGGVKQALDTNIDHGIRIIFSGYIPALLLWVVCIMFITVSSSSAT